MTEDEGFAKKMGEALGGDTDLLVRTLAITLLCNGGVEVDDLIKTSIYIKQAREQNEAEYYDKNPDKRKVKDMFNTLFGGVK